MGRNTESALSVWLPGLAMPTLTLYTEETQGSSPPHEISCLTAQTLLYAVSQVQESPLSIPHIRRRHTLSSRRERAFGNSWRTLRFQIRHISATVAPRGARTHPSDQTDASGANLSAVHAAAKNPYALHIGQSRACARTEFHRLEKLSINRPTKRVRFARGGPGDRLRSARLPYF